MANEHIVELVATNGEIPAPLGIVNVKHALDMREAECMAYSHPEHEAGNTDVFVTRDELAKLP
ncbi:hypothetical protein EHI44_20920 [Rhizobium leguminosarum]|uniref:hypothetical protein n=1 Tax=Rhizobium leguminosarum TaxID=384 RepID=UPI000FED7742|nr:hypothetical protein [Rhizobium leguminosarum]RWY83790.1 hypothetical protein EHI44_20920 [Rhizobium leguminosarum]